MNKKLSPKIKINFWIDVMALVTVSAAIFTGLVLQILYHMQKKTPESMYGGFDKAGWILLHRYSSIIAAIFILLHLVLHARWIEAVFQKRLYLNKSSYIKWTAILLVITLVTIFTGFISLIYAAGSPVHHTIIEIHDKIAILLITFFLYHLAMKVPWLKNKCRQIIMG